jgi:type II secretory pathway pseudopilin PulG
MDKLRQVGFSLVEVIVATALFMGLVLVVSSLAISGSDAQDLGRRIAKMTEAAQEITDDLRLELVSSVRLYGNDAEGNGTLALLAMDREPAPTSVRRLPTIDIDGPFRQDSSTDEITGNAVLFAYLAWRDRCRCASGNEYLVDVYRLVHYYVSPVGTGPAANVRGGLDLVRFISEPLADAEAIEHILDLTDRAEVLLHLLAGSPDATGQKHDPLQVVWLRTGVPNAVGTLRQIDETDGSLSNAVLSGTGRPDPWAIKPIATGAESLLNYRRGAVASNFDLVAPGISRFAVRDDVNGFPHGFEVQLIGPTASRQLLLHLVLIDSGMHGPPAWSQMQTVITARDR